MRGIDGKGWNELRDGRLDRKRGGGEKGNNGRSLQQIRIVRKKKGVYVRESWERKMQGEEY